MSEEDEVSYKAWRTVTLYQMKTPQISSEAFNIVAVGAWNPSILTPEWAKQHLAEIDDQDVVLAIPMNLMSGAPRLTVDNVNIYPALNSLAIDCVHYGDEGLEGCAKKLRKLSELLPHMPVAAIGVNFRFFGSLSETSEIAQLFSFSDAANINAEKFNLIGTSIRRTFSIGQNRSLNIGMDATGDQLRIEFNFHFEIKRLSESIELITYLNIVELKKTAIDFLSEVYGVEIEE